MATFEEALNKRPERIYLLHEIGEGGSDVWCDDPSPDNEEHDKTEYIRADLFLALQNTLKQVREECRYSHSMAINGMASHRDCVSGAMSKALALIDAAVEEK